MLPIYAPWGDLEAYQREVVLTNYSWVNIGKTLDNFWRVSMHYHINVEKGDMLPNDAPWGDLEAYQRIVAVTNYFWVKMGKNLEICWRASTRYLIDA